MSKESEAMQVVQESFNLLVQTSRLAPLSFEMHQQREKALENLKEYINNSQLKSEALKED